MKKSKLCFIAIILLTFSCCTLFRNPLDKRTGFSEELADLEGYICDENWEESGKSVLLSMEKWEKVKPWIQMEIDHDVINDLEVKLTELSAFIETRDKSASLANIRVIINMWANIGSK
ncbi:MAG: DUF4363 family protein [Clostridiaceae bacterium]|jgi:hypothetical protein|nr:DUF4363 family protein [Clostridiaceae bacterium]